MASRGGAARQEQVFFSSRSGHSKTKKVKPAKPALHLETKDDASDTSSKRRISTVASLRAVKNVALPHSKAHIPAHERERSDSHGSSTVWGSLSTMVNDRLHDNNSDDGRYSTRSGSSEHAADRNSLESRHSRHSEATTSSHTSVDSAGSESKDSKFWDDNRISNTVTYDFISDNIRSVPGAEPLIQRLNQQVAFGDGLTETTYAEWIMTKARKFFLTLVELGIPEQIFGITDDAYNDDDLPISFESVPRLQLSQVPDAILDKKFHRTQYNYLIRFLYAGAHIDFEEFETIPLEVISTIGHGPFSHSIEQVSCPKNPHCTFTRKQFSLVDRNGECLLGDFMAEIEALRTISHQHIVELHASYTHKGWGYLLFTPATNLTIKSFLNHPPSEFCKLTEDTRRFKLLDWMRCLSDGLAYLYDKEIPHGDIRPRSVVIDGKTGEVYFSDVGSHRRLSSSRSSSSYENERYDYSAPELFQRVAQYNISQSPTMLHFDGGRTGRRLSNAVRGSLDEQRTSVIVPPNGPDGVRTPTRMSMVAADAAHNAPAMIRRTSITLSNAGSAHSSPPSSPGIQPKQFTTSTKGVSGGAVRVAEWVSRPAAKSDVFSLGCLMLDMLTFHSHKKKLSNFASARGKHNRAAGSRGGGQPDSSFHANLNEVGDWIKDLKKEAVKRDDDAVIAVLILISRMLQKEPEERPTPREVGDRLFQIMQFVKKPHCEQFIEWSSDSASFSGWSGWDDQHDYAYGNDGDQHDPHDTSILTHPLSKLSLHHHHHNRHHIRHASEGSASVHSNHSSSNHPSRESSQRHRDH